MSCPKCGFAIQEAKASSCPKCGVIFAKVQKALDEEVAARRKIAAERTISAAMEEEMVRGEDIRASFDLGFDSAYASDEKAYPVTRFLSEVFVFMAVFTAVIDVIGLIYFYHWGKLIFSRGELVPLLIILAAFAAGSVVVLLAIAEGLKMGRDVANHVRASREYLRKIAGG